MVIATSPASLLADLHRHLKPYRDTGLTLSDAEVCALLRNIRSIEELVRELEEEIAILERNARKGTPIRIVTDAGRREGADIVPFPARKRLVICPSDGGDAA